MVGLLKVTAAVAAPLHNVWLATAFTVAVGFTVIVKVIGVPVQLVEAGVAVIVAVIGAVPVLVAVKPGILPVPLAGNPIAGLELVQLIVAGVMVPPNITGTVVIPLQYATFDTGESTGVCSTSKFLRPKGRQPGSNGVGVRIAYTK